MYRNIIVSNHHEFKTFKQQDASEFLLYYLNQMKGFYENSDIEITLCNSRKCTICNHKKLSLSNCNQLLLEKPKDINLDTKEYSFDTYIN